MDQTSYHLGILTGLAISTNPEIASAASESVLREHDAAVDRLQDRIAELECTLASLLTAEELTILARYAHSCSAFTSADWGAHGAASDRLRAFLPVAPTTPAEPEQGEE